MIIDKIHIKSRFSKSLSTYNQNATVQLTISNNLLSLIQDYAQGRIHNLLEIGCGTGFLTQGLIKKYPNADLWINDLVESTKYKLQSLAIEHNAKLEFLPGDAELIAFPQNLDMICSSSTFQWFSNLPNFIKKVSASLPSNGILAFSTFGPDNFKEIRELLKLGLHYPLAKQITAWLSEDFDILHQSECTEIKCFKTALDVLKHIKLTGVNSLSKTNWTKKNLNDFQNHYRMAFSNEDDFLELTYHPIYIIAQKK